MNDYFRDSGFPPSLGGYSAPPSSYRLAPTRLSKPCKHTGVSDLLLIGLLVLAEVIERRNTGYKLKEKD